MASKSEKSTSGWPLNCWEKPNYRDDTLQDTEESFGEDVQKTFEKNIYLQNKKYDEVIDLFAKEVRIFVVSIKTFWDPVKCLEPKTNFGTAKKRIKMGLSY